MKKNKLIAQAVEAVTLEGDMAQQLQQSTSAVALKFLHQRALSAPDASGPPLPGRASGQNGSPPSAQYPGMDALKERCLAFGINASETELLIAGLHLLSEQTETALEATILQSLRADRSCRQRRARR